MTDDVTNDVTDAYSYSTGEQASRDNRAVPNDTDKRVGRGPQGLAAELETPPTLGKVWGGLKGPTQITPRLQRLADAVHLAGFWSWLWDGDWQDNARTLGEPFPASLFGQAGRADSRVAAAMRRINEDFWAAIGTADRDALEVVLLEEEMLLEYLASRTPEPTGFARRQAEAITAEAIAALERQP